jgi:hypothetical protein
MKALSPLSQEYIVRMTEEEWRDLYKRLRLFSYKKFGMLQTVVGGLDLEAVILDSIEDTFFGVRRWPVVGEDGRIKNISLCVFLCQTIRSKVSHILEQEKNKVPIEEAETHPLRLTSQTTLRSVRAGEGADELAIYNELGQQLLKAVHQDELLTKIVKLYLDTPDLHPLEVAEQLGLPVEEIQNARKRLDRKIRRLREGRSNG